MCREAEFCPLSTGTIRPLNTLQTEAETCLGNCLLMLVSAVDLVDQGQSIIPKVGVLHGLRVDAIQGDEGDAPGPLLRQQGSDPSRHIIIVHHHMEQLVACRYLRTQYLMIRSCEVLTGV